MIFVATKHQVFNRGEPSDLFLAELLSWGRTADEIIFAPNENPHDIYSLIFPLFGPWKSPLYRRACLLEVMRVHAGFESSWNWKEGVDKSNETSKHNIEGQETGIFQVSFDSIHLGDSAMKPYCILHDIATPEKFIPAMKICHKLALDYYARLIRISIAWAGPLARREILPFLQPAAVSEFQALLQ